MRPEASGSVILRTIINNLVSLKYDNAKDWLINFYWPFNAVCTCVSQVSFGVSGPQKMELSGIRKRKSMYGIRHN